MFKRLLVTVSMAFLCSLSFFPYAYLRGGGRWGKHLDIHSPRTEFALFDSIRPGILAESAHWFDMASDIRQSWAEMAEIIILSDDEVEARLPAKSTELIEKSRSDANPPINVARKPRRPYK